jgi:hypothetical protein
MNYIVLICNLAEDWYIQYPTAALDNIKTWTSLQHKTKQSTNKYL